MDFSFLPRYYELFIKGTGTTLVLAFFTVILGTALGLLLSLMKTSKSKILRFVATAYIEFLRGTPLLVQLYIIYFGLPNLIGMEIPDLTAGIIALAMNSGAYVAEIIRAGINAVDKGQMEAARSLGMSNGMAMRYIVIPQAFKNILPALGNEFITIIKESSIVSIIGIGEIMYNTNTIRGNTFRAFEPLIIAAIIYFVLTFTLSKILGRVEGRLSRSDSR